MNQIYLGHRLGAISSPTLQRFQNETVLHSLEHACSIRFWAKQNRIGHEALKADGVAHQAGCTALSVSASGQFLASTGGDGSICLWDLESSTGNVHTPSASLARASHPKAHKNSITSVSIYPFDPSPSTLLTTSFDNTFLLTRISPSGLRPVHTFPLDFAPYCHAISPIPSTQPLVAVGTAHPATRLLDLRSGHSTHSLPGHNGAVYGLAWSPRLEHVIVSGATDGRVLFFDIRRANSAFASLDLDDAVGVDFSHVKRSDELLDFKARAHNGPVTSVQFTPHLQSDKLVTTGHDQRIRIWDASRGRNELVHFGPKIRNDRIGQLSPLVSPAGYATRPSQELLLWPNDDNKGEVHVHSLREGQPIRVMKMVGLRHEIKSKAGTKILGRGRINQLAWRLSSMNGGLELLSAHGDGSIAVWQVDPDRDRSDQVEKTGDRPHIPEATILRDTRDDLADKRKRKRELLEGIVEGLAKKTIK